jgi:hypothetical protein
MPLVLKNENAVVRIVPTETWQRLPLKANEAPLFDTTAIVKMYYITTAVVQNN